MCVVRRIIYYLTSNFGANAERAQTQGKVKHWHQTVKNRSPLEMAQNEVARCLYSYGHITKSLFAVAEIWNKLYDDGRF